ncbi:MAG: hypothetical protein WC326_09760 [Candidatus Delongbacteria bacterium]
MSPRTAPALAGLLLLLWVGAAAAARTPAPVLSDSLRLAEIQILLDEVGMGYSRTEMERTMLERVRGGLRAQDSSLARSAEPHLEAVVKAAFDQHQTEVRQLQELVSAPLAAAFTTQEIRELTRTFRAEPVRRLLTQLQSSNTLIQDRGAAVFSAVGRDVQVFLRAKLAVESQRREAQIPPLLRAPPKN